MGALRIVVLVPWRPGEFRRERNWGVVRPKLEEFGWPIFTGDSEGTWARARAVNAAAEAAGDWDVALISDADTIGEKHSIDIAIKRAVESGGGIRPHSKLFMFSPVQTSDFISGGIDAVIINFKTVVHPGGGLMVVSRSGWDAVGGYDNDFVEWGHEDSHFNTRLLAHADWDIEPGNAFHLWHPRDTTKTPNVIANRARMWETQAKYAEAITRESEKRGYDLAAYL